MFFPAAKLQEEHLAALSCSQRLEGQPTRRSEGFPKKQGEKGGKVGVRCLGKTPSCEEKQKGFLLPVKTRKNTSLRCRTLPEPPKARTREARDCQGTGKETEKPLICRMRGARQAAGTWLCSHQGDQNRSNSPQRKANSSPCLGLGGRAPCRAPCRARFTRAAVAKQRLCPAPAPSRRAQTSKGTEMAEDTVNARFPCSFEF